ncbi:MAG TPA: acyl-CoA dehydrogenase family protein [Micromonosporaceae bacterium]|jgi:alkylation response protein AidB-like acyl-CoA dehydrogenase|nr:acyl-CoA dehydrogenase family protein [Micromonosporaceae bacterium]
MDARRIADEVLFPAAAQVDATGRIPASHFDLLAAQGWYGRTDSLTGAASLTGAVETLASGCLSTTFVWLQHFGALRAAGGSETPGLRERWLAPLAGGQRRAGIALGALRPGPPSVRATPVGGGYVIDGTAPWVTGWGYVDTLLTAARTADGTIVWALLDAVEDARLTVTALNLAAVNASRTVHIRLDGYPVPADRVTGTLPYAEWPERDAAGLRLNGSLALGVVDRCRRLGRLDRLEPELAACRSTLDTATPQTMPAARAAASALAMRAASALMVSAGARGILAGEHAERLIREAAFLLVFGSRPGIRQALSDLV